MSFDPNDPRITAYVFGELEGAEREQFEVEQKQSPELREVVEKTRETLSALEQDLKSEPSLQMSDAQRDCVRVEIDSRNGAPSAPSAEPPKKVVPPKVAPARPAFRRLVVIGSISVVATAVVAVGAVFMIRRGQLMAERQVAMDQSRNVALSAMTEFTEEEKLIREKLERLSVSRHEAVDAFQQAEVARLEAEVARDLAQQQQLTAERLLSAEAKKLQKAVILSKKAAPDATLSWEARARGVDVAGVTPLGTKGGAMLAGGGVPAGPGGGAGIGGGGGGSLGGGMGGMGSGVRFGRGGTAWGSVDNLSTVVTQEFGLVDGEAIGGLGVGPGSGGDKHDLIVENEFLKAIDNPLSTFSIDVDTASYSKMRMYLMQHNQLPRRDAVRIEELVNYFPYSYEPPTDDRPFAARMEVAQCPWNNKHRLLRVAIKGKEIDTGKRPSSNLVFLLDVSGSMRKPNKLPLLKRGMKMLVDQLGENDRVAIVVYAGAAGMVLDSTNGDEKATITEALDRLRAGGSTNGGEGIHLAYQTALDNYIKGGVNRVILCTDGDFNVGITGNDTLTQLAERKAKTGVFLSVMGFGMGNHNDAMLEGISNKGNGNYAFIDTDAEARKVLVEQMSGTLVTIAKDVKIQVEFNPAEVGAYRLIGYENRILAAEDFNNDKKDAGEIGAGHNVTALYELVPAGKEKKVELPEVDDLKYQKKRKLTKDANNGELLTLKLRYKAPDGDKSKLLEFPLEDEGKRFGDTDKDFRFAAAVAAFGMLLRESPHKGDISYDAVLEIASEAGSDDQSGYRAEFVNLVNRAKMISGK